MWGRDGGNRKAENRKRRRGIEVRAPEAQPVTENDPVVHQVQQEHRRTGAVGDRHYQRDHRHVETVGGKDAPLRLSNGAPVDVGPDPPRDRQRSVYNCGSSNPEYVSIHLGYTD